MEQRRYGARLAVFSMSAILFGAIALSVIAIGPASTLDGAAMAWTHVHTAPWLTDVRVKGVLEEAQRLLHRNAHKIGNRLEALSGNRKGQHSVRINSQFRVCFVWTPKGPKNVEIVDYH